MKSGSYKVALKNNEMVAVVTMSVAAVDTDELPRDLSPVDFLIEMLASTYGAEHVLAVVRDSIIRQVMDS